MLHTLEAIPLERLPRRKVRYWLYRLRDEALEGNPANGVPEGLKEHFEGLPDFTGFEAFAGSWDIPHHKKCKSRLVDDEIQKPYSCDCGIRVVPLKIVGRLLSVWEEWDRAVLYDAPILPGLEHLEVKGKNEAAKKKQVLQQEDEE